MLLYCWQYVTLSCVRSAQMATKLSNSIHAACWLCSHTSRLAVNVYAEHPALLLLLLL
jgi:hypothetical protein